MKLLLRCKIHSKEIKVSLQSQKLILYPKIIHIFLVPKCTTVVAEVEAVKSNFYLGKLDSLFLTANRKFCINRRNF